MQEACVQTLLSDNPRLHGVVLDAGISTDGLSSAALCDALLDSWAKGSASIDVWTTRMLALMEAHASREHAERFADIRNGGRLNICLNMIVKDEAHVIRRCLESVRPYIHSWCIVDTGSTDGTQEAILEALAGIPGTLHERPWVNFGVNRNEAMDFAKDLDPTHMMFIDADETLEGPGYAPLLCGDGYLIPVLHAGKVGRRFWMVRADYQGRWVGTVHEDMQCAGMIQMAEEIRIVSHADGARSKDPKARDESDLELLLDQLITDPQSARSWFYAGELYLRMGNLPSAKWAFEESLEYSTDEAESEIVKDRLKFLSTLSVEDKNA